MKMTVILAAMLGVILVAQTEAAQLTVSERFDPPSEKIKAVEGTQDYLILYWDESAEDRVRLNPGHSPEVYIKADLECTACDDPHSCETFKFPGVAGDPVMDLCLQG